MAESPKDERYQVVWDAIQRKVCSVCLDQRDDGSCGLSGRVCAIERHLPGVVQTVLSIESDRMDEYVAEIEAQICGRCSQQDAQGRCSLRSEGDCALYAYLHLIVDAIQEVKEAEGRSPAPRVP